MGQNHAGRTREVSAPAPGPVDDIVAISQLLQNWVIWRDSGDWERFATVWHDDGQMVATWFRAGAAEFVARCKQGFESGVTALHILGGSSIDIDGDRAVAQTRMQILQRGDIDGVSVDVTCFGRFVDALEKRDGRWGIVLRHPVYELDQMIPVIPGQAPRLEIGLLESFPLGYRNLAYLQTKLGFDVDADLPGTRGPGIAALMSSMERWLGGAEFD